MSNDKKDDKNYPFPYDYWVDKENSIVYAVIEYNDKKTDFFHSNLYLVSSKYYGK